jgi:uncharacterized protein
MGLRAAGRVAALAAALSLTGCAAMIGGYDLAPNGLSRDEDGFRRALAFEAPRAYRNAIEGRRGVTDDDLLRLLYAGTAGRYAGAHHESSRLLDLAAYLAEDRVTASLSREALSLLTSERALPYVPGRTERLMIHYLAALNFLETEDVQGAAVEARRIEALLDQMDDVKPGADRPADSRFFHHFAGLVFVTAGDANAAGVAFRRAGRGGDPAGLAEVGAEEGAEDGADAQRGEIVVLVEQGFVPHRVEQSVIIVLPPPQVKALTDGSGGEKTLAAAEAAARVLLTASHYYGDRSSLYRDHGFRSGLHIEPWRNDRCEEGSWSRSGGRCVEADDDGRPYLMRVSWPVLYQEPATAEAVRVRAGELGADPVARLDVSAGARRDFEAQRPGSLARTIARAATKMALSAGVEQTVAKRDEAAGQLAGLLTNLGTMLTERADTRAWHLLPGTVTMLHLSLPPGSHDLTLEMALGDGAIRPLSLGPVTVRAGEATFVSHRIWR